MLSFVDAFASGSASYVLALRVDLVSSKVSGSKCVSSNANFSELETP